MRYQQVKQFMNYGVPEGKERGKVTEILFKEIMADNFPNMERELDRKFMKHTDPYKISTPKDLF